MTAPEESDLGGRLAVLMREQADLRLGAERAAPPFVPTPEEFDDEPPPAMRRFLPLIAALVVLVLGLGVYLLVVRTRGTVPAVPPPDGRTQVLDARIALPAGWVVKPAGEFDTTYYFISTEHTFCITPKANAANRDWTSCPVWIGSFDQGELGAFSVPDLTAILFQDHDICRELQTLPKPILNFGQRNFGGRSAEWRSWRYRCSATKSDYFEDYVVETGPDWVLSMMKDSDEARQAMAYIAEHSQLPAQTTQIVYHDQGVVTKVAAAGDVTTVTMDRLYGSSSLGATSRSKVSVSYPVKTAVYASALQGKPLRIGDAVRIDTDGTDVTWLQLL